jgi:uncharacterized protein YqhQ
VFAVSWSYLGGVVLVVSRQLVVSQWRFSVVMLTIMNADDDDDDDDDDFEEEEDCADGDVMVMELVVLMMTMMLLLLMMMMVVMLMLMLMLMLTLMLTLMLMLMMMMMLLLLVMTMTVQFCVEAGAGRMLTYVWNGTNALAISYFRASAQATALRTCPDAMQQPGLWGALEELMM